MKTILEISKELGVSKQRVYRYYKNNTEMHQYADVSDGVVKINDCGVELIKKAFGEKEVKIEIDSVLSGVNHDVRQSGAVLDSDVVGLIQQTIETLTEQLRAKDELIRELNESNTVLQKEISEQNQYNREQSKELVQLVRRVNEPQNNLLLLHQQGCYSEEIPEIKEAILTNLDNKNKQLGTTKKNIFARLFG